MNQIIDAETIEHNGLTYKLGRLYILYRLCEDGSWHRANIGQKSFIIIIKKIIEVHGFKSLAWKELYLVLTRAGLPIENRKIF